MTIVKPHVVKFHEVQKKLRHRWESTQIEWHDPVSQEFEKKVMIPLFEQVQRTQREMERLTQVIEQAHKHVIR